MSALASDAMKGLNKAEKAVNEAKTVVEPSSAEKPLKTAKNGQKEPKKELSPETQRAVQQMDALKKMARNTSKLTYGNISFSREA